MAVPSSDMASYPLSGGVRSFLRGLPHEVGDTGLPKITGLGSLLPPLCNALGRLVSSLVPLDSLV